MISNADARCAGFAAVIQGCSRWAFFAVLFASGTAVNAPAEIVFQDFFTAAAGDVSNSVPWIDVEGNGWEAGGATSQVELDGNGHIYDGAAGPAAAGIQLVPIGPHGSMTAMATMLLPTNSGESIYLGFANSNEFLTSTTVDNGPMIQVQASGGINFYGGAGLNNLKNTANAFTNDGNPVQVFLTYDAFHGTANVGTIRGGLTNMVLNRWPVTNTANAITAQYLVIQFSTNLTTATARWVTDLSVDWYPRPPPMLLLPVPILQTNFVGVPGTNDILLIQNAFSSVSNSAMPTEIRFNAGATYVISNSSLTFGIPLVLGNATNVVVNGNGGKILITNPRIGFMSVSQCSNIIVENFSVDYDPLPYTQGIVTHNFSADTPGEAAIEFQVDAGYPAPTNANYVDANAVSTARRWGTVMDTNNPGRAADDSYPGCIYTNVVQTNTNGAFKVYFQSQNQAKSIQPGAKWHMISRWNGSTLFNTYLSSQVTWLNNTNYAGAGISYGGSFSPLLGEIGDQIRFGPPPTNATAPRLRTSNADGGYFGETRIGPWVEGCNFTGLSDDCANPYLAPFIVTNLPVQPTNTLELAANPNGTAPVALLPYQAQVGDNVLFMNASSGIIFDRAQITAVNLPAVTFDHAVSNLVTGTYDTNTLLLDETLDSSAVYLNNQFSNGRQHGIYCRANNTLIAHNTISGMELSAVAGFPAFANNFLNLFAPTNVVILDNILSDCGYSEPGISNAIPAAEPAFALVEFHQASLNSDYVANDTEISGLRILYNAFLDWRRAPLTLHNATDVNIMGNYFGPPVTNDGLVPLTSDVLADLWASDYPNLRITNNVNGSTLSSNAAISEDGAFVSAGSAFQLPAGPQLTANVAGSNVMVSWVSPAPGFIPQQASRLVNGSNNWADATNSVTIAGMSNVVTVPVSPGSTKFFFRTRQR